ncbi:MAG: hypothetical protein WCS65_09565 [Verrucomicrobiae bacterium]
MTLAPCHPQFLSRRGTLAGGVHNRVGNPLKKLAIRRRVSVEEVGPYFVGVGRVWDGYLYASIKIRTRGCVALIRMTYVQCTGDTPDLSPA